MQAYSANDLNNLQLQNEAEEVFEQGILSKQSFGNIKQAYPCSLYTPVFFIRIALALLCIVCISFAASIFFLILYSSDSFIMIFLLMFIACYVLLEYMVKTKKYYNAGIDNVLQVFTIIFFAGMFADGNYAHQDIGICVAVIIAAAWLCIRFTDAFMGLIAFVALLTCVFLIIAPKNFSYNYIPFVFMLIAAIVYFLQLRLNKINTLQFYRKCLQVLGIAALIAFYAACNVYVVNNLMQPVTTFLNKDVYVILWIFSTLIPLIYCIYGFKKQQVSFLRVGFLCAVATIVTIHFYYSILSTETALILGGFLLIMIGYISLKYFKNARQGFTSKAYSTLNKDLINLQTLISLQAGGKQATHQNIQFGGGSSGGAGASGNW